MNDLRIQAIDAAADSFEAELRRWYDAYLASTAVGRDDASPWRIEELLDLLGTPNGHRWCGAWLALRGDEVVGGALLDLPLADNRSLALPSVHVVPAARRTGVGTVLAGLLERESVVRGRSISMGEVEFGLDGPDDGAGTPGVLFAQSCGYAVALGDIQRRLALPVDPALLDRLAAEAVPHHAAYELVSFHGPVPDEIVAGYAALAAQLLVEAPAGDLAFEAEDPSVAGWRDREAALDRQGMTLWHTAALTADGEVVAHSTIAVSRHDDRLCHQWGTLVRPDHRGHRLGLAVKVANHRALQHAGVPAAEVVTWNATVNDHMVAINDQLGFHRVGRLVEVQKHL